MVGFISVSVVILPLVFVLGVLSYVKYTEANLINSEYIELEAAAQNGEAGLMVNQIRSANSAISMFQNNFKSAKEHTKSIEQIVAVRPTDLRISKFHMTNNKEGKKILLISGISGTRDSIINFGSSLENKNGGMCASVNVPVTTYARRVEVPFNITCEL